MKVFRVEDGNLFPPKSNSSTIKIPIVVYCNMLAIYTIRGGGGSFNARGRVLLAGK